MMTQGAGFWGSRLRVLGVCLLVAAIGVGCDSNEEEGSDAETLAGEWILTRVLLNGQDFTALVLAEVDEVEVRFMENDRFEMEVRAEGQTAAEVEGTYSLNEDEQTITLQSSSFEAPVVLDYDIQGNGTRVVLTTDDVALLSELAGIDLDLPVDRVDLHLERDT